MTQDKIREAFEDWYTDPDNPRGIRRTDSGEYALMQARISWQAYQAAVAEMGKDMAAISAKMQEMIDSGDVHEEWYKQIAKEALALADKWRG
jgi:hypothetical protein